MSKLNKALGALRAVVKGIPEEMIDTHIRNLLDFCERTIEEIEVEEEVDGLNYKTGEVADSDKVVSIVVEGGMVVEVNGLPVDWQYYIDDRDCPPEIEDE